MKAHTGRNAFVASASSGRTANASQHVRVGNDGHVASAFAAYRYRKGDEQVLVGRYEHRLVQEGGELKIALKRIVLSAEALRPHGTLSIIL